MIRINFSGHPVAGVEIAPLVGANLPTATGEELTQFVSSVLDALPCREELECGAAAEVVLPGLAPVAGVLLALWHGRFGSFPAIKWSVRTEAGFVFTDKARADLQELRLQARTGRQG